MHCRVACRDCLDWIASLSRMTRTRLAAAARERGEPIDHTYAAALAAFHRYHEEYGHV